VIRYTLKIEIVSVVPGDELATSDFIRLKENVGGKRPAFRLEPVLTSIPLSRTEPPKAPITPEDLKIRYAELGAKATAIRSFLENRVGQNLNMPLDRNQPDVWNATHDLFKGDFNEVSFTMYTTLVNYVEELGRELGDALR
jgi:hypothetical protein